MATKTHETQSTPYQDNATGRFIVNRFRFLLALILIAMGGVFLLAQAGILDLGDNWWVIFIAIPGFVALASALVSYRNARHMQSGVIIQVVFGLALLLLSAILIWDPTWSFTRGWNVNLQSPVLRDLFNHWPWLLVVLGVASLFVAFRQRAFAVGLVGGIICLVGVVFILNISWNVVWPLAIVAVGFWLLFFKTNKKD